ncbi:MAG: Cys-tRNA(Pro) deacylase [Bacilli bacterium]
MKKVTTMATRTLDQKKIAYTIHTYDTSDDALDGVSVANKIGLPQDQVFKTIVTIGASKKHYVALVPVACSINMKQFAHILGEKSVSMLPLSQLLPLTGYQKGGCSPIGMRKVIPTYIDASAANFIEITCSAGKVGAQMTLAVEHLLTSSEATLVNLIDN